MVFERSGQYELRVAEKKLETAAFVLDLGDLEANAGQVVYADGQCWIEIMQVSPDHHGGYDLFFKAHGVYGYQGGRLVTPLSRDYSQYPDGGLVTAVGGTRYAHSTYRSGGAAIHLDGDSFGFQLFPTVCYEPGEFLLAEAIAAHDHKVTVQLVGLYELVWQRK